MQLNNTVQYAIRVLSYMSAGEEETLYNVKALSEELEISYKFLTKIMTVLSKADLIVSIRGRVGGFKLAKKPSQIALIDIISVFDPNIKEDICLLGLGECDSAHKCALHDQWIKPKADIQKMLEETTLDGIDKNNLKF